MYWCTGELASHVIAIGGHYGCSDVDELDTEAEANIVRVNHEPVEVHDARLTLIPVRRVVAVGQKADLRVVMIQAIKYAFTTGQIRAQIVITAKESPC